VACVQVGRAVFVLRTGSVLIDAARDRSGCGVIRVRVQPTRSPAHRTEPQQQPRRKKAAESAGTPDFVHV
jgi:hypothetical protein